MPGLWGHPAPGRDGPRYKRGVCHVVTLSHKNKKRDLKKKSRKQRSSDRLCLAGWGCGGRCRGRRVCARHLLFCVPELQAWAGVPVCGCWREPLLHRLLAGLNEEPVEKALFKL